MQLRSAAPNNESDEDADPYWISFSDIMSALLLIFILAVVVLVLQLTQKQDELGQKEAELAAEKSLSEERDRLFAEQIGVLQDSELLRSEMLHEIENRLSDRGIKVEVSTTGDVLSIPTDQIGFAPGSYEIPERSESTALAIGSTMAQVVDEYEAERFLDTVFVEGHTDDIAHQGLEGTGNWGLSTFRAISLWRTWEELPTDERPAALTNGRGTDLFSVSGYADTRPVVAVQDSESARSANRRIDLRFTVVGPSAEELDSIITLTAESS